MGGYTPNGKAHLGSLLHIHAINLTQGILSKTISFNDLDSKTSIRNVSNEVENDSEKSFQLISNSDVNFSYRTTDETIMEFFSCIQKDVPKIQYKKVLGRVPTVDEQMSLNIQAAAYLVPQLSDKDKIVIGFYGIEEASQVIWINYVAKKYHLKGFINFVSLQIPGFEVDFKMGKSKEAYQKRLVFLKNRLLEQPRVFLSDRPLFSHLTF